MVLPRRSKKNVTTRPSRRKGSWWSALAPAVHIGRGVVQRGRMESGSKQRGTSSQTEDLDNAFGGEDNYEAYGGKSGRGSHAFECTSPLFEVETLSSANSFSSSASGSSMDTHTGARGDVVKRVMLPSHSHQQSASTSMSSNVMETVERKSNNNNNEVGVSPMELGGSTSTTPTMPSINNSDMLVVVTDSGLSRSERYELIHFLRKRDTKLKDEAALLAKVDKLASYPRKQLVVALSRLYGDVPVGLSKMRHTLQCVEEESEGGSSFCGGSL